MHISREPLVLQQQMSSFDKKYFTIRGLSFMGIVEFSIWLNSPSKYRGFIVSVIVGIFSEILTGTSCQDFFPLFFGISVAAVK